MVGELNVLTEWIPEQMGPGTVFVLENAGEVGEKEDPYWAVLACPSCGTLGLITRRQIAGLLPVICGSERPVLHPRLRNHPPQTLLGLLFHHRAHEGLGRNSQESREARSSGKT
jgi:hypothetical protein